MPSNEDKRNIEAIYPLSPMQQGMLFESLYAPESGVYVEQFDCTFRGALNAQAFQQAWEYVVGRHPALRTSFVWKNTEEILQVVHRRVPISIDWADWRDLDAATQDKSMEAFLHADRDLGFNLAAPPLLRLKLVRVDDDRFRFIWSHHHALLDGWSGALVLGEVVRSYATILQGRQPELSPVRPYRDYITWLRKREARDAKAYWQQALAGMTSATSLVVDRSAESQEDGHHYAKQVLMLSPETTLALQELGRQHQVTLGTFVHAAWALLLGRYSGEEDVLFGATVSGRPTQLTGIEAMIGLFINTLPVRARIRPEMPAMEWLVDLQQQLVEMREHEHSALTEIQGWSEIPRGQPLFQSLLVFENYPVDASLRSASGLVVESVQAVERSNYPLTVVSGPGERLPLEIHYDAARFDDAVIARMLGHLSTLLEGIAAAPQRPLCELPLLTKAERERLLVEWNATNTPFADQTAVHGLFEQQAAANPQAIALRFQGASMTYNELNRRANQLARALGEAGVAPGTLVGLCLERSFDMIVALLGILKAGGAYLPLDADYPRERLAYMLADSQAPVLVTHSALLERLPVDGIVTICVDRDAERIAAQDDGNLDLDVGPEDLAYVIYTSGSTGQPKGVLLVHRGVCNLMGVVADVFDISAVTRMLQFSSLSFDASVVEILGTLTNGGRLCLARRETLLSPGELIELVKGEGITILHMPPSLLTLLDTEAFETVETVASVGEACSPQLARQWSRRYRFLNGYGPTEATVATSFCAIEDLPADAPRVSIGGAIANTQIYVLDGQKQPAPVGVPGELYVSGVGLARGYLNRPELTTERFVPNPFSEEPGARMYKTGDLVRWLEDGTLDFLGRIDHQIKIRGFRVELGEIEAVLGEYPAVQTAVVMAREDEPGQKRLVAYIVGDEGSSRNVDELREHLDAKLPDYMVPNAFVILSEMPLTPNGKIDRGALPAPQVLEGLAQSEGSAPRTPTEEVLVEIWAHILTRPSVATDADFFDLGGHSLLVIRLLARIRQVWGLDMSVRSVFEHPTVAKLAREIDAALRSSMGVDSPAIVAIEQEGPLPLSYGQHRLWFLDQLAPGNLFYTIPMAVKLSGALDVNALQRALQEIVQRHQVLRTTFVNIDGTPMQVIAPTIEIDMPLIDLADVAEEDRDAKIERLIRAEVQQPFDLSQGPLLRGCLLRLDEQQHVVVLVIHHIVADGWSVDILLKELGALYAAFSQNQLSPLEDLPIQYSDYAQWQRSWLTGDELEKQLAYWREQLGQHPPVLELPTDRPRPSMQSWRGAILNQVLPSELAERMHELARQEGSTLFMALLAAFQVLLHRYTGQGDISVGTPVANRAKPEIQDLIGFFVNTLVIKTEVGDKLSFRQFLRRVREATLGAYAHQDLPFETLVDALQPERRLNHTPLFQVAFTLQNVKHEHALGDLPLEPLEIDTGTAKFDLTLIMTNGPDGLNATFEYNTDLFDRDTIERMAGHLHTLLQGIVAKPDQDIAILPILSQAERAQILVEWNRTDMETPTDRCAHELFEACVDRQPNATALLFEGQSISYQDLNWRANRLAHRLQAMGVGPEVLVGIAMERGPDTVTSILATLKAGGAYLPLDPSYPRDRLAFMLADAQVPIVITESHLLPSLPDHDAETICLDDEWLSIADEPDTRPRTSVTPSNLAYVIYTSGSTGCPKGTMLTHSGLSNLTRAQQVAFNIDEHSRVLQFAPLSFDASVWEMFMALANGATLCLAPQERLGSPQELIQLVRDMGVTNATLPPSVLRVLPKEELPTLQTIISAGEACTVDLVQRWAVGRDFYNAYGPTETTVCASMYRCSGQESTEPPIGRPLANMQLYVLDTNRQPLPIGVPGELYIGGAGLARGYLRRPELTAERFVPDPFSSIPARLYRSGDLVRYRPDGNIEFLGRIDNQVKIRGFRIELGEIEAALREHDSVQDVAVIAREDVPGDQRLVAYVVPREGDAPSMSELRSFLQNQLPGYMVPSAMVTLEALPLSPSGKVDRRALPKPDGAQRETEYAAPQTPTQQQLASIFGDLLGISQVGIYDHFFEIGGHSLLATRLVSRLREAFRVELPLQVVFEAPTVSALAERVDAVSAEAIEDVSKILAEVSAVEGMAREQVIWELEALQGMMLERNRNRVGNTV